MFYFLAFWYFSKFPQKLKHYNYIIKIRGKALHFHMKSCYFVVWFGFELFPFLAPSSLGLLEEDLQQLQPLVEALNWQFGIIPKRFHEIQGSSPSRSFGASLVVGVHLVQRYRFNPWSGRIPHASSQLSWCTTTTEPIGCDSWSPQA